MSRGWQVITGLLVLAVVAGCAAPAGALPPPSTAAAPAPAATSQSTSAPMPPTPLQATPMPPATSTATPAPASTPTVAPTTAPPTTAPATQAPPAPHVIVDMKNFAFVPKAITVAPGTVVTWRNDDDTTHTATADDKLFNSGDLGKGAEFSYTFTKPGTYPYYCVWHGAAGGRGMSGTVTVK